jgi:hypothetical protein
MAQRRVLHPNIDRLDSHRTIVADNELRWPTASPATDSFISTSAAPADLPRRRASDNDGSACNPSSFDTSQNDKGVLGLTPQPTAYGRDRHDGITPECTGRQRSVPAICACPTMGRERRAPNPAQSRAMILGPVGCCRSVWPISGCRHRRTRLIPRVRPSRGCPVLHGRQTEFRSRRLYSPVKAGGRFSVKATMASVTSLVITARIWMRFSRAIDCSKVPSGSSR